MLAISTLVLAISTLSADSVLAISALSTDSVLAMSTLSADSILAISTLVLAMSALSAASVLAMSALSAASVLANSFLVDAKSYRAPTTIFSASGAVTNLTLADHAGEYLIKTDTGGGTFNLPSSFSAGDHFTFVYAPASTTTTTVAIVIDAAAGDNITWYDGSASVYANSIQWNPKAGSAITVIGTVANSNWVAIGTDQ